MSTPVRKSARLLQKKASQDASSQDDSDSDVLVVSDGEDNASTAKSARGKGQKTPAPSRQSSSRSTRSVTPTIRAGTRSRSQSLVPATPSGRTTRSQAAKSDETAVQPVTLEFGDDEVKKEVHDEGVASSQETVSVSPSQTVSLDRDESDTKQVQTTVAKDATEEDITANRIPETSQSIPDTIKTPEKVIETTTKSARKRQSRSQVAVSEVFQSVSTRTRSRSGSRSRAAMNIVCDSKAQVAEAAVLDIASASVEEPKSVETVAENTDSRQTIESALVEEATDKQNIPAQPSNVETTVPKIVENEPEVVDSTTEQTLQNIVKAPAQYEDEGDLQIVTDEEAVEISPQSSDKSIVKFTECEEYDSTEQNDSADIIRNVSQNESVCEPMDWEPTDAPAARTRCENEVEPLQEPQMEKGAKVEEIAEADSSLNKENVNDGESIESEENDSESNDALDTCSDDEATITDSATLTVSAADDETKNDDSADEFHENITANVDNISEHNGEVQEETIADSTDNEPASEITVSSPSKSCEVSNEDQPSIAVISPESGDITDAHETTETVECGPELAIEQIETTFDDIPHNIGSEDKSAKKKKKKTKKVEESVAVEELVDENKQKNKKSKKREDKVTENVVVANDEDIVQDNKENELTSKKKKKKVKKSKLTVAKEIEAAEPADLAAGDVNQPSALIPEVTSFDQLFNKGQETADVFQASLQELYAWRCELEDRVDDLPRQFINNSDETVWQYILHSNKQLRKNYRKHKDILEEALPSASDEESEQDEDDLAFPQDDLEEDIEDEDEVDDEEECDLFNLKGEDLEDLEKELEEMKSDDEEDEGEIGDDDEEESKPRKKYPKSVVDDKFFSLAEMNDFVNQAEKEAEKEDSILASVDDSWGGAADYRYEDFFGKLDDVVGEDTLREKPKKRKRVESDDTTTSEKKKKKVRFADEEPQEDIESPVEPENDQVLLGAVEEEEEVETNLKKRMKKLRQDIEKIEQENLQPRSWELSGEVTGKQRDENALLETHVDFEYGAKQAPEVTEDFTAKLEALIIQRIKDKTFDDVVRKKKIDEGVQKYRNEAIEETEMMKKSLSEVYEKEYQTATGEATTSEKPNEAHVEIEKRLRELFRLVDALSHFHHTPPEVRPEVKVISNMSAIRVEEVGMTASTDAQLLAPEEMKKRQKGDLKAHDERDSTDKLRARRKKKSKQRAMVIRVGEEKALAHQIKKKKLKSKEGAAAAKPEKNMKSSNFFTQLQETVSNEIKQKTKKKKVKSSEQSSKKGSKFKL